jgi:hypothetical protein
MDERLLLWINQGWASSGCWTGCSGGCRNGPGSPFRWRRSCCTIAFGWCGRARRAVFLLLALTVAVGDLLGNLLKDLFAAPRPCQAIFEHLRALGGAVADALEGSERNAVQSRHQFFRRRDLCRAGHALARLANRAVRRAPCWWGLSRIYLGKHYPSQVSGRRAGRRAGRLAGRVAGLALSAGFQSLPVEVATAGPAFHSPESHQDTDESQIDPASRFHAPASLSLVVPLYNELDNVAPLLAGIHEALADYPSSVGTDRGGRRQQRWHRRAAGERG